MIGNSVQIILGDQEETAMSRDDSGTPTKKVRKYGRPSANYYEVAEKGLKTPANDNGGFLSKKTKTVLAIVIPILLGLAFLAWF